jgi:curved DNA-binding protein CbpA
VQTYYETLGVPKTASEDEIRVAYRRLAKQYHPDVNGDPDANERFIAIQQAYEVLIDPDARARYDAALLGGPGPDPQNPFRHGGFSRGGWTPPPSGSGISWSWQKSESSPGRVGMLILMLLGAVLMVVMLLLSLLLRAVTGGEKRQ